MAIMSIRGYTRGMIVQRCVTFALALVWTGAHLVVTRLGHRGSAATGHRGSSLCIHRRGGFISE